jgi:small subunit ribosomal protein S18
VARPSRSPKRSTGKPKKRKRIQIADDELRFTNVDGLKRFLSERGKIRPRTMTGLSRRQQALVAREVKRARELSLLPYVMEREGTGKTRAPREDRR